MTFEPFEDLNQNGVYDEGENFNDLNEMVFGQLNHLKFKW